MRRIGIFVFMLALAGCAAPSKEDRDLISINAAAGVGDIREWDKLTDAQKKEAHLVQTQALCVLDHNINGKPYPQGYEPAPVTSAGK